ncbi:MAG TPA: diguanylate cyclase [Anaerolineales bacterium]|nr:diguanylate cyclase [Anaerolineales bacterium]
MESNSACVLLIEDNPGDARLIREYLREVQDAAFVLEHVDRLALGLDRLAHSGIDLVLLDLSLPDAHGIDTFLNVHTLAPSIPIVVLTGLDDQTVALQALREGAQDYLVKGQVNAELLERSLRYAIERNRLLSELDRARQHAQQLSLIDELTGLYNRRGFFVLAEQQIKLANRRKRGLFLVFSDLDGLKSINDRFGHAVGDQAIVEVARLLASSFRESDILARIGGDEFVVIAIEASQESGPLLLGRLHERVLARNTVGNLPFTLSVSCGIARYEPDDPKSLDDLLAEGDRSMYVGKKARKPNAEEGSAGT